MDDFLYNETISNDSSPAKYMTDKQVLMCLDQNGGSYNGQIQFETSSLSTSGRWLAYSEAYLEIPFQIAFKASANLAGANVVNAFMLGLKNGTHNLIDSIQVDMNGQNVVSLQPFLNFFVNYKLMTSFSADDAKKWGSSIGFAPDSSGSYSYSAVASANGDGHTNNVLNPVGALAFTSKLESYNSGALKRFQTTAFPFVTGGAQAYGGITQLSANNTNQSGKNYVSDNGGVDAARIWQWNIMATIRLRDLADYFDKVPLLKGSFYRFTINYNSASMTTTVAGATMITTSLTMKSGRTNPVLVASAAAANPSATAADINAVWTITCGVGQQTINGVQTASGQTNSCRMYVPAYKLNPVYESQLLTLKPTRDIVYTDIYNYNITGVGTGQSFNSILSNGIVNPKYVVVIPYLTGTALNTGIAIPIPPYQSMFDTAPATTCPLASITQFNVQVGGQNLFQQNFSYDFETFINETSAMNAINGGISTGITSGLISSYDWDNAYRYYVADVSRRLGSEDGTPKSITVQGTNNTTKTMDYVCFVVFEKKVAINMLTGEIAR